MVRRILLKSENEEQNQVRFVVTEDSEPVFQGVFEANIIYSGTVCSVRIKDRLVSRRSVFCDAGCGRSAFVRDCDLLPGKMLLVQAESAEHDKKGTRFSTDINIAGEYVVLVVSQFSTKNGFDVRISRKISESEERNRLQNLIKDIAEKYAENVGFYFEIICRTSACDVKEISLIEKDVECVLKRWNLIYGRFKSDFSVNGKTGIIYGFENVLEYIIGHERRSDFDEIITDSPIMSHELSVKNPEISHKIKCTSQNNCYDIFSVYSVDNKLCQLLRKQVYLKSGAYIVVEFTEAMTVIDVNSGKNTFDSSFMINKEAANEIMRQLRLRDIGGIIVCDFINMNNKESEKSLIEFMKALMQNDPYDIYISGFSKLGLVEIARKRN